MADTFEELLEAIEAHAQNAEIVGDLRSRRDETRYETSQVGPFGWQTSTSRCESNADRADSLEADSKATLKEALDAYVREQVMKAMRDVGILLEEAKA